jgi:hypothetical protein
MKCEVRSWKGEKETVVGVSKVTLYRSPFFRVIKRDFEELGV